MARGWSRFQWVFYLTFLWYVSGFKGWAYPNPTPQWSKPYPSSFSPLGIQSPDVPVSGSSPVEVGSKRSQSPIRSSLALSHQYVKGGDSWPASRQGSPKYTASQDSSRPQSPGGSAPYSTQRVGTYGAFQPQRTSGTVESQSNSQIPSRFSSMSGWAPSQFVSTQRESGLSQSQSVSSQNIPPYAVISSVQSPSSLSNRDLSSFRQHTFGSQGPESQPSTSSNSGASGSSSPQYQGTPGSPQYVRMSEATIQSVPISQSQMPQKLWYSGIQTSGTTVSHSSPSPQNSQQPQMISSQYSATFPTYAKHGGQMATSRRYVSAQQGGMPQHAPALSLGGNMPDASPYSQETPNRFPQFQNWKPSASRLTQSAQTLGIPVSQSSLLSQHSQIPSRLSSVTSVGSQSLSVSTQESSSSSLPQSKTITCPFMPRKRMVPQV